MLRFDEVKATEAAALFLALRGGRMHYMKLIKLLYLADREALLEWGAPITTDTYVSMDHGPVVSTIYDLIRRKIDGQIWPEFVSPPMGDGKEVELVRKDLKLSRLSRADERVIKAVFKQYGHWNRYKLRDFVMHKLPEWQDPEGTSIPITIPDILKAGGEDNEEIIAVEKELNAIGAAEDSFSRIAQTMAAYGDTFLFDDDDDEVGHLHVIITEPTEDGQVITVTITTRHKKSDTMVPLEVGDHPYLTRPSVITFKYARIKTTAEIDKVIENKDAKKHEPMNEKFLRRARSALMESESTPYEVLEFFSGLEKYKNEH